jgi:hypothetical protein
MWALGQAYFTRPDRTGLSSLGRGKVRSEPYAGSGRRRDFEVRLHFQQAVAILPNSFGDHVRVIRTGVEKLGKEPCIETRQISRELPLRSELEVFVDYIAGKGPAPKSSVAEGKQIVETMVGLRTMAGMKTD